MHSFDCPGYITDSIKNQYSFIVILLAALSYLVTLLVIISNIIDEKETKMKVNFI